MSEVNVCVVFVLNEEIPHKLSTHHAGKSLIFGLLCRHNLHINVFCINTKNRNTL